MAGTIETEGYTPVAMLEIVNKAIEAILVGGQSYQIGSRRLTRADLPTLWKMKKELEAQIAAGDSDGFLDDTYVAIWTDTR